MDDRLKQRLVGAAVVVSLGVIFLPAILDGGRYTEFEKVRIEVPPHPDVDFSSSIMPIDPPEVRLLEPAEPEARLGVGAIDAEGKPPVLDDELKKLIGPIEAAAEVVSRQGGYVWQPDTKPAEAPPEPAEATDKAIGRQDVGTSQPDTKAAEAPPGLKTQKVVKESEKTPEKVVKVIKDTKAIQKTLSAAPLPGPSVVTAWVVQVGSFSSRKSAIGLRDALRKRGFSAFVESFDRRGKPSHRVRIGPEATRVRAGETLASLKKKMQLEGIVVSYP